MRIWALILSFLGTVFVSQNALALSCVAPDIIRTLESAKQSDLVYYILVGKFSSESKTAPNQLAPNNQLPTNQPTLLPALFEGYALSQKKKDDVYLSEYPVNMQINCAGAWWCGRAPDSDENLIAFVEVPQTPQAASGVPILRLSPCGGQTFPTSPNGGLVGKVRQCLDRKCKPQQLF